MIEPRFHCGDARVLIRASFSGPHRHAATRFQLDNAGADQTFRAVNTNSSASSGSQGKAMEHKPDMQPRTNYPFRNSAIPVSRP